MPITPTNVLSVAKDPAQKLAAAGGLNVEPPLRIPALEPELAMTTVVPAEVE